MWCGACEERSVVSGALAPLLFSAALEGVAHANFDAGRAAPASKPARTARDDKVRRAFV